MSQVRVTYNAPGKQYIGYLEDDVAQQVTISDAEVNARDEQEQRAEFEAGQDAAELAAATDDTPRGPFQRAEFGEYSPRGTQMIRERIAHELAVEKLGVE